MSRSPVRAVKVGDLLIGGGHPVSVQSMTKTRTADVASTVRQIRRMEKAGCEAVRLAIVDHNDAQALHAVKKSVRIPVIADIHFDYRLAIAALASGADKIRINPGNIGASWKITSVIRAAKDRGVPIRIGINTGSLPGPILKKYGHPNPAAIAATLRDALRIFRANNFRDIVISVKGCDVPDTVAAYRQVRREFKYPLHLGITEAGRAFRGGIKSAVGLGILLHQRIGDTIRVSLTADPVHEIVAGYEILSALNLRQRGPILISCPTCGRCQVDLIRVADEVERRLQNYRRHMKVAVMGCVVNGPGEAREADFGIACGRSVGAVFAKGKEVRRVSESKLCDTLFEVIDENINH